MALLAYSCMQQHVSVAFTLDMNTAIEEGWFNPKDEEVGLRGDQYPLTWSETYLAQKSDQPGIYTITIPISLSNDSVQLNFKIKVEGENNPDDGWQKGRNHQIILKKGTHQKVKLAWDQHPPEPEPTISGRVDVINNFKAMELDSRDVYIYLPPGYEESDLHYNVLYMHDGQNLFNEATIGQEWGLDEAAQMLIESGEIEPIIIVGIANTKDRIEEYTPTRQIWEHHFSRNLTTEENMKDKDGEYITDSGEELKVRNNQANLEVILPGYNEWQTLEQISDSSYYLAQAGINFQFISNADGEISGVEATKAPMGGLGKIYEAFILNELKPFIDSTYRSNPLPESTSIGGASLGGLISLYTGLRHPETFSHLVVLSPSLWWDNRMMFDWVSSISVNQKQKILLYIGAKEGDQAVNNVKQMNTLLHNNGWSVQYIESEFGQHNENAWQQQAENILRFVSDKE